MFIQSWERDKIETFSEIHLELNVFLIWLNSIELKLSASESDEWPSSVVQNAI